MEVFCKHSLSTPPVTSGYNFPMAQESTFRTVTATRGTDNLYKTGWQIPKFWHESFGSESSSTQLSLLTFTPEEPCDQGT